MKKQYLYAIASVMLIAILVIGGTYAYFTFRFTGNNTMDTNSKKFEIDYIGGGSSFDGPLELVSRKEDGYSKTLKIKVASGAVDTKINLYLEIEQISAALATDGFIWEIYGYNSSNQLVYSNDGTFNGYNATTNKIVNLINYNDYTITTDETTFIVYLWLNSASVGNEVLGSTFKGHIAAQSEQFSGIVKQ